MLIALGSGCEFKGGRPQGLSEAGVEAEDVWLPRPVSMRVYPSTRFVRDAGGVLLEARIELLDEMDDPVKGAGDFRLELFRADEGTRMPGRQLYVWRVPMLTLEDQRRFFDPITRAYLLRLRLDEATLRQQPLYLHTIFAPVGAPRLEADAVLSGGTE